MFGRGRRAPALHRRPDLWRRVVELGRAADEEVLAERQAPDPFPFRCWVYPAKGRGRAVPLFKVLLSNACRGYCLYCANRQGRDCPRWDLTPEEMARAFAEALERGLVEGMFLSSSIPDDPSRTMERLVVTAEIVRRRYGFKGYIHLKIMPGAEDPLVERAIELADRVSVNLEAPSPIRLKALCPGKDFHGMVSQMKRVSRWLKEGRGRAKAQTTQFVLGASGESDREYLQLLPFLYGELGLKRCYFEAFRPVPGTPLEGVAAVDPLRQRRLYEASFLIRDYGFRPEELPLHEGNLPREVDPKLAWAREHPGFFPVEVNRAEPEELLRVPGFGPRAVQKILQHRARGRLRWDDLKGLGLRLKRTAPFITADGKNHGLSSPSFLPPG